MLKAVGKYGQIKGLSEVGEGRGFVLAITLAITELSTAILLSLPRGPQLTWAPGLEPGGAQRSYATEYGIKGT